jgi:uncharacterized RDD family membrane protein YckC
VASLPRRFGAVCVDWFMCVLIVRGLFGGHEWAVLGAFALVNVLLISTLGSGFGGRLFGIRVVRLDGGPAYPLAVLVRTLLLCLVVPVFIMDRDGRGLHDQAAGLVVVRI